MRSGTRAALLLGVVAGAVMWAAPARAAESEGGVVLKEQVVDHLYKVDASFEVDRPIEMVWGVLTDFESMPQFVRPLRRSVVRERSEGRVVVEQEARVQALLFSMSMLVRLEIREVEGVGLVFRDLARTDFEQYAGTWSVTEQPGGSVRVRYRLQAKPKVMVPAFIGRGAFRDNALVLLQALRKEINRREAPIQATLEEGR